MAVDRDAFGIPVPEEEGEDEFAFLKDTAPEEPTETPPEDAPAPAEAPVEAPTETPADPQVQLEVPQSLDAESTLDTATPKLYAKRYDSVEKLEDGYQELRELHRRTAERAKEYEDQNRTLLTHAQEVEATLQRAVSALQQQGQQQQQPQVDEYGNVVQPPAPTPQQVQAYVDQQVQYRLQQAQSGWQQQADADADAQAASQAIYGFFQKHPEVEMNSPVDDDIARTIHAIDDAWQSWGTSMDITDPDTIEVAYEATTRPALRHVLEKNPSLVDDEQGMQLARFQASILEGQPITQAAQSPASSSGAQVVGSPRPPVIERAATTSNSPDDRPLDEVDQAFLEYRKHSGRQGDSVFFGKPGKFE